MANGKIYKNQTELKITARMAVVVTGAITKVIKYIKPDGTPGQWTAEFGTEVNEIFFEDFQANTLDQAGDWRFWGHVTFTAGKYAAGEPEIKTVNKEGT